MLYAIIAIVLLYFSAVLIGDFDHKESTKYVLGFVVFAILAAISFGGGSNDVQDQSGAEYLQERGYNL
jgi:hypothetical protein